MLVPELSVLGGVSEYTDPRLVGQEIQPHGKPVVRCSFGQMPPIPFEHFRLTLVLHLHDEVPGLGEVLVLFGD